MMGSSLNMCKMHLYLDVQVQVHTITGGIILCDAVLSTMKSGGNGMGHVTAAQTFFWSYAIVNESKEEKNDTLLSRKNLTVKFTFKIDVIESYCSNLCLTSVFSSSILCHYMYTASKIASGIFNHEIVTQIHFCSKDLT